MCRLIYTQVGAIVENCICAMDVGWYFVLMGVNEARKLFGPRSSSAGNLEGWKCSVSGL